jgi:hypothetical protein
MDLRLARPWVGQEAAEGRPGAARRCQGELLLQLGQPAGELWPADQLVVEAPAEQEQRQAEPEEGDGCQHRHLPRPCVAHSG